MRLERLAAEAHAAGEDEAATFYDAWACRLAAEQQCQPALHAAKPVR